MSKATVMPESPVMDKSIQAWIYNIQHVLGFPITVLGVAGLLVAGAFAQTAPRKSLEFLNNYLGRSLFFLVPIFISCILDWATGLLAAVTALIFFARLQVEDDAEGFIYELTTEIIPTSKRWFVEKVQGETPIAISSDRIHRNYGTDEDSRTSSSSSMDTVGSSDGSSHK
jgi:hypothetical protein